MNREILFRGKTRYGHWVCGSLIIDAFGNHQIVTYKLGPKGKSQVTDHYEVDPSTVGQYTGLTDSKGNKVFEGDIVKVGIYTAYEIKWDSYRAEFNTGAAGLSVSEVIGTIHDTHLTKQS